MDVLLGSTNIRASGTATNSHPNTTTSFYQLMTERYRLLSYTRKAVMWQTLYYEMATSQM